ncbi:hypothetical protein GDO81_018463 [Engystomops pustulosus]|uniref:Uncharacterized protein n=1 Tax=Engystomops pustulosus TaxID=76066 RepID=A0AAV6ZV32_ENGPU|nr:hypothetical protein GDO81_018463 [Engystomops pustulosus]
MERIPFSSTTSRTLGSVVCALEELFYRSGKSELTMSGVRGPGAVTKWVHFWNLRQDLSNKVKRGEMLLTRAEVPGDHQKAPRACVR